MIQKAIVETSSRPSSPGATSVTRNPAAEPIPETMRAIVQEQYGDSTVLKLQTIQVSHPKADQVLIQVDAAGVDRGVWHLMTGLPWLIRIMGFGFRRPKQSVPGLDVSGRVVAIGASVTRFKVGDDVFGVGKGTYAEYALAPESKLAARPPTITPEQAAVLPISGITALQALRDIGKVQSGQRVLIIGASGGVGTYAVQIAKHFGANVTGVASTGKLKMVSELGAQRTIDYTCEDALDGSVQYELIIDIGGRNTISRLRHALTPTGTLVIVGGENGDRLTGGLGRQLKAMLLSAFVRQRLTTFVANEKGTNSEWLAERLAAGDIQVTTTHSYPLVDASKALADLAAGRITGKAVIRVSDARY